MNMDLFLRRGCLAFFWMCLLRVAVADTPGPVYPLQLASPFHDNIDVSQYWVSEKLDGIRARWDGKQLLTRNGNVISAPAWFTRQLPALQLDGELWLARQQFEQTASIVLRDTPDDQWRQITYMVFDSPELTGNFSQRWQALERKFGQLALNHVQLVRQWRIASHDQLMARLDELESHGAEGLMLHHQDALYQDGRQPLLLKLKKYQDAEATVIAHILGRGKYQSMMGSLLVEMSDGKQFKIGSGFSDLQRLDPPPVGSVVSFKYYGLTARGIPRFASFLRVKSEY